MRLVDTTWVKPFQEQENITWPGTRNIGQISFGIFFPTDIPDGCPGFRTELGSQFLDLFWRSQIHPNRWEWTRLFYEYGHANRSTDVLWSGTR